MAERFKIGDRVLLTLTLHGGDTKRGGDVSIQEGSVGTVVATQDYSDAVYVKFDNDPGL